MSNVEKKPTITFRQHKDSSRFFSRHYRPNWRMMLNGESEVGFIYQESIYQNSETAYSWSVSASTARRIRYSKGEAPTLAQAKKDAKAYLLSEMKDFDGSERIKHFTRESQLCDITRGALWHYEHLTAEEVQILWDLLKVSQAREELAAAHARNQRD